MFEADIAGKLPELADREDYLTSCVFGALKYLPPNKGLLPVLAAAKNHRLGISLGEYCQREDMQLTAISEAQLIFWPRCSEPRPSEPDLVVILRGGPRSFILPIEVKYFAGKHGEQEDDQLMRYYCALETRRGRESCSSDAIRQFSGELLALIYVTQLGAAHEIEATLGQMESRGMTEAEQRIFHLKWQDVYGVVQQQSRIERDALRRSVLLDIARLLKHKHLTPFTGFSGLPPELSAEALRQYPVFFESDEHCAGRFSGFPPLPSPLSRQVLSKRPAFLRPRHQQV